MPETEDEPSSSTAKTAINGGSPAEGQEERTNVLFGKYEMGRLLGCGGFAKVYHARDTRTGKSVAVKVVSKQKVEKKNLQAHVKREVSIMSRLRHPHIIRLLEVLATRTKIYFIMEYAKGGELFAKVAKGRFSEDLSRRYFHQLISAVGYCHSRGVYHRDLKPENILLDENWSLKVSDFGLSAVKEQIRSDGMLHTSCGTPAYVAPEIIAKKGYDGAKVDIWSCGVILYVLNAGFLPFNDSNMMNMYRKIYRGEFRCPKWMSPELRRFIGRLLDINPNTRITVDEIIQDPWFNKGYKEVKFKWYDENYEFFGDKAGGGEDNERRYLTAFDLITFSPGFSLSGLFGVEQGRCQETYLSKEVPETVVEKVEDEARRIDAPPRIMVERVKGGMGVRIEGQNGNFGVIVMVHRLTEELAVVEVRMREKDVGPSVDFWKDKLRPRISHLFFQPGRPGSLPGPSQHLNPD